ncbi:MAG: hypothetical protein HFJ50_03910 [Clostridia bacterium]|nr:hypothetical protein [Clostridia bacterium]
MKPKLIPKMDFTEGVPKEYSTMVVVPSILKDADDVRKVFERLEVYYLANKSENIYCTALGDPSTGTKSKEDKDEGLLNEGLYQVKRLNEKYGKNIFGFAYRKRVWNDGEKCYMGWERKRGLLTEISNFLLDKRSKNSFLVNTLEKENLDIKYIITLDADTELTLNSGIELIEAMAHILNTPIVKDKIVISGYGIMQPRVGINLEESKKSVFAEIFAGSGGVDSYTNAISDTYQDNFGEGIYTGKGIYDLAVFCECLKDKIPENTVLSHDLLEGSYLRCGLASDIMLLDGYPKSYLAYLSRLERWIRGDYQITPWLARKSGLNKLSKFKILDNIRRSLIEITAILNVILLLCFKAFFGERISIPLTITLLSIVISSVLEFINYIVFRKENIKRQKRFSKSIDGLLGAFYRGSISIMVLPSLAYISLKAIVKTIYRMKKSKEHLLEWTTSEEAERLSKNSVSTLYSKMFANVLIGIFIAFLTFSMNMHIFAKGLILDLAFLWFLAPLLMWEISKESVKPKALKKLSFDEISYIKNIAEKTWNFFLENMNKEESFLPPDNFQESRREKIVSRTSSTNIGLRTFNNSFCI